MVPDPDAESQSPEPVHRVTQALESLAEQLDLKPKLRGWLHFAAGPLAFAMGLSLLVFVPDQSLRMAVAVYVATTVLLFSVSASYHLGAGGPRTQEFLNRLDHANIYLFIAGSYTPFGTAMPDPVTGCLILTIVWSIAVIGLIIRVFWRSAPRWLSVASYVGLGWVAIFFLPDIWRAFGSLMVVLLVLGGVFYTLGGIVYARKWPNPDPDWFGFHEVFHALTIAAFLMQFGAVAMAVLQ